MNPSFRSAAFAEAEKYMNYVRIRRVCALVTNGCRLVAPAEVTDPKPSAATLLRRLVP